MKQSSYRRLTWHDRTIIMNMSKAGKSQTDIAEALGVSVGTISRELRRNSSPFGYIPMFAHILAFARRYFIKRRFKISDSVLETLKVYLSKKWSPECIANTVLKGKLCYQTIYNFIRSNPEYSKLLFFKRRYRKRSAIRDARGQISNRTGIDERPKIVDRRSRYGDFEGDLVVGANHKGALLTLVERKSRYLYASKLESKCAEETAFGIVRELDGVKAATLTLDNGLEFASHQSITQALGTKVYFAHPYAPHERGTNENTNRLLRRYFPKKTDLRKVSEAEVKTAVDELNSRPRKCLNWKTPKDFARFFLRAAPMGA